MVMSLKDNIRKTYEKLRKYYSRNINKRFGFEVHLADHCNLNCVGCSHFSPLAEEHFLDVDTYRKDCERFSELTGKYVREINLMGGEPLLHKDIVDIMKITRSYFKDSSIYIVTNGILLDKMGEEFWDACNKNNIVISITLYPVNLNARKFSELAWEYNVKIETQINRYRTNFRKDVYDIKGNQNKKENFKKCIEAHCHHLYEGKFYVCPIPAYIKYFNKYFSQNLEVSAKDYIDIYQKNSARTIRKYFRKSIPFCRYCNMNAHTNIKWSVSKKEISEWI
jgi:organic radical activating enzyme